jgi:hypothetical protein
MDVNHALDEAQMMEEVERQYQSARALVDRFGLAIPCFPGGADLPPVVFTIGGAAQGEPDLVAFGLPARIAQGLLNSAFQALRGTWPHQENKRISGAIDGFAIGVRDVSQSNVLQHTMFLTAVFNARRGHAQTPIVQILWPDKNGLLPFERGCDPATARIQRIVEPDKGR